MHRHLIRKGYLVRKAELSRTELSRLCRQLTVSPMIIASYRTYTSTTKYQIYRQSSRYLFIPRFYGLEHLGPPVQVHLSPGAPMSKRVQFPFQLRDNQQPAYQACHQVLTRDSATGGGGGVLCLPCGMGKTFIGLKLAYALGRRTLIVVNKEFLMEQWIEAIRKFTQQTAVIGRLQQKTVQVEGCDFVIAMLHSVSLCDYPPATFESFGMTIIDECHHMPSKLFSQAFHKIGARYMLGLSATPKRSDGLSKVIHWFLGPICYQGQRALKQPVTVKQLSIRVSGSVPQAQVRYMSNGNVNTSLMITQLSQWPARTHLIVQLALKLAQQGRKILILSGRRAQLQEMHQLLSASTSDISFGYYYGKQQGNKAQHQQMLQQSATCQIILGTYSIASEGLDIPDLNTEILATPMTNVEQAVGRILRKHHPEHPPLIIDLVDQIANYARQGTTRARFYRKQHYTIDQYRLQLPAEATTSQLTKLVDRLIAPKPIQPPQSKRKRRPQGPLDQQCLL